MRGVEGKIAIAQYARENKIPFFGICLGMQVAVIEFARHVCDLEDAHSGEFDESSQNKVIHLMEDQKYLEMMGGTMRLGAYPCNIVKSSLAYQIYRKDNISERHRHRYEFNNDYRKIMEEKGLLISGISPDDLLVEIIEIPDHPFYFAVQFHPEFKSRPDKPQPIFKKFIQKSYNSRKK